MADKELYNLLGRGSPAGKALFNIYNGDSAGKKAGNEFHSKNRRAYERKLSKGWQPPELHPSTPPPSSAASKASKVAVPRVGRGTDGGNHELVDERGRTYFHYQLRYGGRKTKAEIIREMEAEWANPAPQPASTRPLLDDKEKDRLVTMMRWRGKPPEVTEQEIAVHRRTKKEDKTRLQELEELFDQTVKDIDDRREFLERMKAQGLAAKYEHSIRAEIHERIRDMKKLDGLIAAETAAPSASTDGG